MTRFLLVPVDELGRSYPGQPVRVSACPVCRCLVAEGNDYELHVIESHTQEPAGRTKK